MKTRRSKDTDNDSHNGVAVVTPKEFPGAAAGQQLGTAAEQFERKETEVQQCV